MGLISFFKRHCLICNRTLGDSDALCLPCLAKMPFLEAAQMCRCCGIELAHQHTLCGECLSEPPYFSETHALWKYDSLASHLIQRLKFYEDFSVLPFLVKNLAQSLQNSYQNRNFPEIILPVPTHFRRLWKRGFNQTDEIGKRLAKALDLPIQNKLLYKVKPTAAQSGLHIEERTKNLKSAFAVKGTLPYRSIALLDDVMTTGSTVNEIANVLTKVGVAEVHVWVLARAMKTC